MVVLATVMARAASSAGCLPDQEAVLHVPRDICSDRERVQLLYVSQISRAREACLDLHRTPLGSMVRLYSSSLQRVTLQGWYKQRFCASFPHHQGKQQRYMSSGVLNTSGTSSLSQHLFGPEALRRAYKLRTAVQRC